MQLETKLTLLSCHWTDAAAIWDAQSWDDGLQRARRDVTLDPSDYYYEGGGTYTEDDLQFILVEPVVVDGVIRIAIALDKPGTNTIQ